MIDPGLQNKVVLVTGANNPFGIGAAIAEAFAAQGACVFITYLRSRPEEFGIDAATAAEATTPGESFYRARNAEAPDAVLGRLREQIGRVGSAEIDLADPEAIPRLFDRVEETLGPVDILINNAAHTASPTVSARSLPPRRTGRVAGARWSTRVATIGTSRSTAEPWHSSWPNTGAGTSSVVQTGAGSSISARTQLTLFRARCPTERAKRRWNPTVVPPPWNLVRMESRSTWWLQDRSRPGGSPRTRKSRSWKTSRLGAWGGQTTWPMWWCSWPPSRHGGSLVSASSSVAATGSESFV